MKAADIVDEISQVVFLPTTEYDGELSGNQRNGIGKETWSSRFENQQYKGKLVYDSLHGPGDYTWQPNNAKTVYEGLFYTSKLEGYGQMSFNNNSQYEGLFRNNSRFGPGVFTNSNGTQDVGMWYGKNLMRLCVNVKPEWVPKIARSARAKVNLLKYKTLVKICDDVVDYAKEVLHSIGANEEVLEHSDKLYNTFVRHPKSLFFNTTLYDTKYFLSKDCYIEIAANPLDLRFNTPESEFESSTSLIDFCIKAKNEISGFQSLIRLRIKNLKDEINRLDKDILQFEEVRQAALEQKAAGSPLMIINYVEKEKKNVCWEVCQIFDEKINSGDVEDIFQRHAEECSLDNNHAWKALNAAEDAIKILNIKRDNLLEKLKHEELQLKSSVLVMDKKPTKKVLITDLLAWNNEETTIEMMKHAFLHRNFEKTMSFCVQKVLCGDRSEFRSVGKYEEDCIAFLTECSNGDFQRASNLLVKYDLNPDMCDARGNTGIIFAAARDRHKMLKTLINFGGNVDVFNDESITPLALCVLRYLAVQNYVTNWEAAFFRTTSADIDTDFLQWRPQTSLSNILENISGKHVQTMLPDFTTPFSASRYKLEALSEVINSNPDLLDTELTSVQIKLVNMLPKDLQEVYPQNNIEDEQLYLFNVACVRPEPVKTEKKKTKEKKPKKEKKGKAKKEKKKEVIVNTSEKVDDVTTEILLRDKLRMIHETITLLLSYGSDPNASEVPMPVLLMALFTKNVQLVDNLLEKKADPNVTTSEEELSGLHILVSMHPCETILEEMRVLFKYEINPNLTASVQHWPKEREELIGKHTLQKQDMGKMPLHLLAMRFDFLNDYNNYFSKMAQILIENGALPQRRYLGHTPLSLAVLRGNIKLVQALLETGKVNPNFVLGEDMGTVLTLLILKRYTVVLNFNECENIIQTLLRFGANPFASTGERGNVIEFINKEHEVLKKETSKKEKGKKVKEKKSDKKGQKPKMTLQDQIRLLIENEMEAVLYKHIKGCTLNYLYQFVENQDYYDEICENMARFLNVPESIVILQALFHRGIIPIDKTKNYETLYGLIEFILNVNYPTKSKNIPVSENVDISKLLENFDFKKQPFKVGYLNLPQPEVDEQCEKYVVCFYCYKKLNCQLFKCPKCKLVYFCSERCNLLSNKFKSSTHKCNVDFYATAKEIFDEQKQLKTVETKGSKLESANKVCKSFNVETEEALLPSTTRFVKPDPKRRLHLTRKKTSQVESIAASNKESSEDVKNKKVTHVKKECRAAFTCKRVKPKEKDKSPVKEVNLEEVRKVMHTTNCAQFRQRLPKKYQYFLKKIVEFWPDLDLSVLFLPYACYSNGQLYYRFGVDDPVFAETYSNL